MTFWLLAFSIAFVVALGVARLVIQLGIADLPDEDRKNHKIVTPTSGGLGILAGVICACAYAGALQELRFSVEIFAVILLAVAGGLLGLADDIKALGSKRKLALMAVGAAAFVAWGARIETLELFPDYKIPLGTVIGGLGTIFWLLVMVNTTNFMDGANGMAMGCAGFGLLGLAALNVVSQGNGQAAGDFGIVAWSGFAACLGFLVWNAWKGAIFAGDCGALFVGYLCGSLGVVAVRDGIHPLSVAMCFLPMLTDVILTIVRRLRRGDNVLSAHSQHAYQRAIRAGAGHLYTSSRYWAQTALTIVCALIAEYQGGWWPLGLFVLATAVLSALYVHTISITAASAKQG